MIQTCGFGGGKKMINDNPEIEKRNSTMAKNSMSVMDMVQGITKQEYLNLLFQKEYNRLSRRAQKILADIGIVSFNTAYNYYMKRQDNLDFKYLRNIGKKTNAELSIFFEELEEYFNSEIATVKEEIASKQTLPAGADHSIQKNNIPVFNNKMEIEYQKELNDISARSKNILRFVNADSLKGFYTFFFIRYPSNWKIRKCGKFSKEEIIKFKKIIAELIDKYKSISIKSGLFSDFEIYFQDPELLDYKSRMVFDRYFEIHKSNKKETLAAIGNDLNLTRERIRQIGLKYHKTIHSILVELTKSGFTDINQYFKDDFFIIDDSYEKMIYTNEGTNFSKHFICYALSLVIPDHYKFYNVNDKLTEFSGIFYRNDLLLNIPGCLDLIRDMHLKSKKSSLNKIELVRIIELTGFTGKSQTVESTFRDATIQLAGIIGLYNNFLPKITSKLIIKDSFLFFKINPQGCIYEKVIEVLKTKNKPMHYKEIYQCFIENNLKVASAPTLHQAIINHPEYFGLKGPGTYGLKEWGGYFGTIGDVTEQLLIERNAPISRDDLIEILCHELIISRESIMCVLFNYKKEGRFIRCNNNTIALKKWFDK